MFDLTIIFFLTIALAVVFGLVRAAITKVVVEPHEAALLIRNGKDRGRLAAGVHRFFLGQLRIVRFDQREVLQKVGGQEVLTRDRVPVKFTVLVRYLVRDAVRAHAAVQDVFSHIHAEAQLALREAVALFELDELLDGRATVSERLASRLREALSKAGLELVNAEIQDLMVGGDLKRAFGDVARARAEGLAKLERARGEAAALRKLANAARLLKEHEGLDRLKTLEVAARAAEGFQTTLVLGLDDPSKALRQA